MSRRSLAPFVVIATAVVFAGCSPDPTTAPVAIPTLKGPSATIANLTNATVIFDQRSTMPTGNGLANGQFSIYAGDDFDVPSTWKLTEVVVSGILIGPTLTFSIRENLIHEHPTIPGATYSTPGATVASFTMAPTASDPNPGATDNFAARDYLFKLSPSVTLAKGHYWLTVLVNDFDAGAGESKGAFIWQQYPTLNWYPGAFTLDAEGTSWTTSLGNVAFVLFGEVLQKPQTITFPAITPNPSPVGSSATLSATATSGLTVAYTSLTTNFCTVAGTTVSFKAVGTCTVAADQAGDASWLAAGRQTQSVEVSKGSQAITFTSKIPGGVFVGARWAVMANGGQSGNPVTFSSLSPDVCTFDKPNLVFIGGGTCIVAANQAGSDNYNAAPQVTQEIPVDKLGQTIQFTSTPPSPAFALDTYDVTVTGGGSNNPVTFSSQTPNVCTVAGSTVTFKIGGLCTIAADQLGNAAYSAAPQATQSFSVIKINQKVNQSNLPREAVVGSSMTPVLGSTSGLVPVVVTAQPSSVCVMVGDKLNFVGVGACIVGGTQAGNDVYNPSPKTNFTVNVIYGFQGFASPVQNDGVLNSAKAGQTIPLAWRLVDAAGVPVTNLTTATITAKELACAIGSTVEQIAESAAGESGLQNLGNGYYQMNWKTPSSYKNSCKTMTLTLGSGGSYTALFQFTK